MNQLFKQISSELFRLVKMALWAAGGLLLLVFASLFSSDPPSLFFRLLSLLGTAMLVFSVAMMILTFRKASEVKPGALIVSLVMTLATLALQLLAGRALPVFPIVFVAFAAGILVGGGWSKTRLFFVDNGRVRSRGTAWYLVVWALVFMLNQLMATFAGAIPVAMSVMLLLSSGIVAGSTLEQLRRFFRVQRMLSLSAGVER